MRGARRCHGTSECKGPAAWVVQFGSSQLSTDVLAASDKYFSIAQQRGRVGTPTNAHAARGCKRPRSRIIKIRARVMSTRDQHLAIGEQCGGMEDTHNRHIPSSCRECPHSSIVNLRGGQRTITVVLIKHASIPSGHKHFSTL